MTSCHAKIIFEPNDCRGHSTRLTPRRATVTLSQSLAAIVLVAVLASSSAARAAEIKTLQQALTEAYRNNPSLEAERAKLRAIDEQVAQALSHWRPSVKADAAVTRTWQNASSSDGIPASTFAHNGDSYDFQVTQPLFRGFRTLSETEEAEEQVKSGRAQLQSAEQQLLLDTGKAFLDALRDEVIVQIDHDEQIVLQKKLDETTARAKVGDLSKTDIRQAETRLARAEVTDFQAQNTLTADRAAFLRLVGEEAGSLQAPSLAFENSGDLDGILHRADTANPSVIAAQYAEDAAKSDIDLNKGSLLPEVNLVGSSSNAYGQNITFPGRELNNQVMVQLSWQLYDGGANYSKIRAARQTATQKRMELEEARHKAHETAHNAWQELETAEASIKADEAEIEAASQALDGVKVEAKVGSRTTLDVLNAEQELLDARTDMARAQHDRDYAILQIESAVGTLTADALKLAVDVYDPDRHYDDNSGKLIGFGDDAAYVVGEKNKPPAED